jgi:hypothetical protein
MLYAMSQATKDRIAIAVSAVGIGDFALEVLRMLIGSTLSAIPMPWMYGFRGAAFLSLCILALWAFDRCRSWVLNTLRATQQKTTEALLKTMQAAKEETAQSLESLAKSIKGETETRTAEIKTLRGTVEALREGLYLLKQTVESRRGGNA